MSIDRQVTPVLALAPKIRLSATERHSLCDVLDRVLNKGAVIDGEATISVAGVDLVYLGLKLVLTSIETARQWTDYEVSTFNAPINAGKEAPNGNC